MARSRSPGRSSRKRPAKPKRRTPARKPKPAPKRAAARRTAAKRKALIKKFRNFGYTLSHLYDEPRAVLHPRDPIPMVDLNEVEVYRAAPLGVYGSPAEAQAAMTEIRHSQVGSFTSGLAIGLAAVAVIGLGIVLCYVLFRRKGDESPPTAPNIIINNSPAGQPATSSLKDVIDVADDDADVSLAESPIKNIASAIIDALKSDKDGRNMRTFIQSYTLPFIGDPDSEAIRVATAGNEPFEVVVRCVEPPGSHAVLAFDPVELNVRDVPIVQTIGALYSGFPVGNVLPVPAGQFQIIRMRPRQVLYAKGTVAPGGANQSTATAGVILAVTAADFVSGISW